jgi:hypothetical protein
VNAITGALEVQAKDASSVLRRGILTRWTSSLIVCEAAERNAQPDEKTGQSLAVAEEIEAKLQQGWRESATAPQPVSLPQPSSSTGLSIQHDAHRPSTSVEDPRGASRPASISSQLGGALAGTMHSIYNPFAQVAPRNRLSGLLSMPAPHKTTEVAEASRPRSLLLNRRSDLHVDGDVAPWETKVDNKDIVSPPRASSAVQDKSPVVFEVARHFCLPAFS